MNKTCIIIAGPTASGKTSLALQVAKHFSTSIISADSRQCYRELGIGVAKPTASELAEVHHYFIDSHSIHDNVTAADFEKYALSAIEEIFNSNDMALMVGGTGLYLKSFTEGLDNIPVIPHGVREFITALYNQKGIQGLQQAIKESDPVYYETGEILNPRRLMRALEVTIHTGQPFSGFHSGKKMERDFDIIKIAPDLGREELYERINNRVDAMIKDGLIDEAKSLHPFKNLQALQTVGYTELFDHFEGKHSLERAIELIKQNSRRYAKRQLTWFKKDVEINWIKPGEDLLQFISTV